MKLKLLRGYHFLFSGLCVFLGGLFLCVQRYTVIATLLLLLSLGLLLRLELARRIGYVVGICLYLGPPILWFSQLPSEGRFMALLYPKDFAALSVLLGLSMLHTWIFSQKDFRKEFRTTSFNRGKGA